MTGGGLHTGGGGGGGGGGKDGAGGILWGTGGASGVDVVFDAWNPKFCMKEIVNIMLYYNCWPYDKDMIFEGKS